MSGELKIGWGFRDISTTEPTCIHGQFHVRISQGILDPITVTALALESNGQQLIMLSCDITGLTGEVATLIREKVHESTKEIDTAKIIMNATHTHCTGDVNCYGMCQTGVDFPVPPSIPYQKPGEYRTFFVEKCAEAIIEAWNNRTAGAIAWGYGYAAVAHSRKTWFLDDLSKRPGAGGKTGMAVNGHASMYGNTSDPMFSHYEAGAEHQINFLYTFDLNKKLTGAIINLPCPSQCSEGMTYLTADYWNDVRVLLHKRYGDINILPQCAPAGDLSPHIQHYKKAQARRLKLKFGPAEETYQEQYNRKDIAERIGAAFDDVLAWASKDIRTAVNLRNSIETIQLERRQNTPEEYENEIEIKKELDNTPFQTTGTDAEQLRANSILAARRARAAGFIKKCELAMKGETYPCDLHVAAIDDIAFVTSPFELYSDFMHRIIARSPFIQTFNIQLADNAAAKGGSSYLATERGVEGGGYSSSRYCNVVSPKGGQQLVEATLARLNQLSEN
ncbi:MAG: hypothetical protein J6X55_08655 [Victivallales bacterium]|nr:hypothetical protein [Victivallales bacterium]